MIHYAILILLPVSMALIQPWNRPWGGLKLWIPVGALFTLFIGFRDEVGGDWGNYLMMYKFEAAALTYSEALEHSDPAYWLLMVWMHNLNQTVHWVNFVGAIIFMVGLIIFLRRMPNPWLGLVVATAYLIIVVVMGYVRQGIALGFILWAITALSDRKFIRFMILVFLATSFHKTAILMAGLGLFVGGKAKYLKGIAALLMVTGIWTAFVAGQEDQLVSTYVEKGMESSGAYIRIIMNVVPAIIFLLLRKTWKKTYKLDYVFWLLLSYGAIASLFLVSFASTAIDRIGLYFIPLQIVVFSRLPTILKYRIDPTMTTFLIVFYYVFVCIVWFDFASWSFAWLPYQNLILDYLTK